MKRMLTILLLCVLCITGCSKSAADPNSDVVITWENGQIMYDGEDTGLTKYSGYQATIEGGKGGLTYEWMLDNAKDVTNITINYQGILQEDMDKYRGMYYYSEYLSSKITCAKEIAPETFLVCQVVLNDVQPATAAAYVSEYMENIPLTNGKVSVDFGDFTFGNDYDVIEVRNDCALILGTAKVSKGTYDTTSTVSVIQDNKEFQLQKGSSTKYDYYVYNDYVIQLAAGLDINNYIKFK